MRGLDLTLRVANLLILVNKKYMLYPTACSKRMRGRVRRADGRVK